MIDVYEVVDGWSRWYTLDRSAAVHAYEVSGESDKSIRCYRLALTSDLLVTLLNNSNVSLGEASWTLPSLNIMELRLEV